NPNSLTEQYLTSPPGILSISILNVLTTVSLHSQSVTDAAEIDDVASHWHLPAKMVTIQLAATQPVPQFPLGIGGSLPHLPCKIAPPAIVIPSPQHWLAVAGQP